MGLVNDFIVDSNQHCFLCLAQISQSADHPPVKVEPGSQSSQSQSVSSPSIYSIQYLSRYVEVDMLKVFNHDDGTILPHLLDKVRRSKLNVELCGDCAHLNTNFSKRVRQLEKLEMELGVTLSRILDKLLEANKMGREEKFRKLTDPKSPGVKGKLEIMKALRTDVMEKCSCKLAEIPPRVSIPKPKLIRKMNRNKLKLCSSSGSRHKQAILHNPSLRFAERISKTNLSKGLQKASEKFGVWEEATMDPVPPPSQECQPTEEITAGNNVKVWVMQPPPVPMETSSISSNVESSSPAQETVEDYACDICGMRFMFQGNLQFHSKVVHKTTSTHGTINGQFGLHLKSTKTLKPYQPKWTCRCCGSVFAHWIDFQDHLKTAHPNEFGHICEQCGLKLGTKIELEKHRLLEHKVNLSEVITPDDPTDNQKDDTSTSLIIPVSEAVPILETVETGIVKMESNNDHLTISPLACEESDNGGRISATLSTSTGYNEDWIAGLSQLSKTVGECEGRNVQECDICHLMVPDISTHLYTVHFEQSGSR